MKEALLVYLINNVDTFLPCLDPFSLFLLSMTSTHWRSCAKPRCNHQYCICGECLVDEDFDDDDLQGTYAGGFMGSGKVAITGRMILRLGSPDLIKKLPYREDYYKFLPIIARRGHFDLLLHFASKIQNNVEMKEAIMQDAIIHKRKDIARQLYEWGGLADSEHDFFENAFQSNSAEMFYLLQDLGFKVTYKNAKGKQQLQYWKYAPSDEKLVKLLIENAPALATNEGIPEDCITRNDELGSFKNIKVIQILFKPEFNDTWLAHALNCADLELVKYFIEERGCRLNTDVIDISQTEGMVHNLALVKYLLGSKVYGDKDEIFLAAIRAGQIETTKYFIEDQKLALEENHMKEAISSFQPNIMKLLYRHGCPITNMNFSITMLYHFRRFEDRNKQLTYKLMLAWNLPWGNSFDEAIYVCDTTLLEFMISHGYNVPHSIPISNILGCGLRIYKLLRNAGVILTIPPGGDFNYLERAYYADFLQYLKDTGYKMTPAPTALTYRAFDNEDERLVDFLIDNDMLSKEDFMGQLVTRKNRYILQRVAPNITKKPLSKASQKLIQQWCETAKAKNNDHDLQLLRDMISWGYKINM